MDESDGSFVVAVAGKSDTGRRRKNNEDVIWWRHDAGGTAAPDAVLLIADGMGGAAAGEVASNAAMEACVAALTLALDPADVSERLKSAVEGANERVFRLAQGNDRYAGMGTTLSVGAIVGRQLWLAHVGDSRCYLIREGTATQLTTDHTWVADEVRSGRLAADEAASHPARKAISRAVGIEETVDVELVGPIDLVPGDSVLMCSDGLTDVVADDEIAGLVAPNSPRDACGALVRLANDRGGPDNVSVVIARIPAGVAPARQEAAGWYSRVGNRSLIDRSRALRRPAVLAFTAFTATAVVAIGSVVLMRNSKGAGSEAQPRVIINTEAPFVPTMTHAPSPTARVSSPTPTGTASGDTVICDEGGGTAYIYEIRLGEYVVEIALRAGLEVVDLTSCDHTLVPDVVQEGQRIKIPCPAVGDCPPSGGNP